MQVVTGFRHPFAVDHDGAFSLRSQLYKTATTLQAGSPTALEAVGLVNYDSRISLNTGIANDAPNCVFVLEQWFGPVRGFTLTNLSSNLCIPNKEASSGREQLK